MNLLRSQYVKENLENNSSFIERGKQSKSNDQNNHFLWICALIITIIISTTTFGLFVYSALKVQFLTQEVSFLRQELEKIKLTAVIIKEDLLNGNLEESDLLEGNIIEPIYDYNDDYDEYYSKLTKIQELDDNATESIISLEKREIPGSNEESHQLERNNDLELSINNEEPLTDVEMNTRRTRAHSWRKPVDVEEVEPKNVPTLRRRNRNRHRNNLESLEQAIVHFSGDTSKYVLGKHENFRGNGHLRHPDQTFADWKESDWVKPLGMSEKFDLVNGYLKIKENGLYFIYSQIYYLDEHDTNGFNVYKNRDPVLQCTVMTHSMNPVTKGNTCYTAGVEYLREGDEISIRDVATHRYSLFEPGKSFFGAIKLGDHKVR